MVTSSSPRARATATTSTLVKTAILLLCGVFIPTAALLSTRTTSSQRQLRRLMVLEDDSDQQQQQQQQQLLGSIKTLEQTATLLERSNISTDAAPPSALLGSAFLGALLSLPVSENAFVCLLFAVLSCAFANSDQTLLGAGVRRTGSAVFFAMLQITEGLNLSQNSLPASWSISEWLGRQNTGGGGESTEEHQQQQHRRLSTFARNIDQLYALNNGLIDVANPTSSSPFAPRGALDLLTIARSFQQNSPLSERMQSLEQLQDLVEEERRTIANALAEEEYSRRRMQSRRSEYVQSIGKVSPSHCVDVHTTPPSHFLGVWRFELGTLKVRN
jgi:uncharacterized protein YlxW (UPF0749 family)